MDRTDIILTPRGRTALLHALLTATDAEAEAVWHALDQYIDNNDPEECGEFAQPDVHAAAQTLQEKLDAAMASLAIRRPRVAPVVVVMQRSQALALGLLRCSCGHPPNNHFDFDNHPCAHCGCKHYDERVSLPRVEGGS